MPSQKKKIKKQTGQVMVPKNGLQGYGTQCAQTHHITDAQTATNHQQKEPQIELRTDQDAT